ncbi:MAG: DUF4215 domain-containing protein [Candidatus Parcubacteria bacterium]|nr:DUF4215 domain-containing protein [Candidatus Parcubacteria bacterium]
MAIDFLGKEGEKSTKKEEIEIKMHSPEKQVIVASKSKEKPKIIPKKETPKTLSREKFEQVNLIFSFKQYIWKRRLTFIVIFVIIIAVLIGVTYWLITRPKPVTVVNNTNINNVNLPPVVIDNTNQTPPTPPEPICGNGTIEANEQCDQSGCGVNQNCVNCQCQQIIIPPVEPVCGNGKIETGEQCDLIGCSSEQTCVNCQCQQVILPDTELAPLRGALVKFSTNKNIYLIDYNGELRLVDPLTASFKNNQAIREIKEEEIYLIADRFKTVRMGKIVSGKVDWDPRILSSAELILFQ